MSQKKPGILTKQGNTLLAWFHSFNIQFLTSLGRFLLQSQLNITFLQAVCAVYNSTCDMLVSDGN